MIDVTSTDATATPTDSELQTAIGVIHRLAFMPYGANIDVEAQIVAQALADQRAKCERLADELDADQERAYQRSVKGYRIDEFSDGQHHAYEDAADRIRKVAQQ